jgi:hypothetical protein
LISCATCHARLMFFNAAVAVAAAFCDTCR